MSKYKYKTTGNIGLFDQEAKSEKLSSLGNPLEKLNGVIDFEMFRFIITNFLMIHLITAIQKVKSFKWVLMLIIFQLAISSKTYSSNIINNIENKSFNDNDLSNPIAVKTNIVFNSALTPNLALELPIKNNFSLELSSLYNAWDLENNVKWKNLGVITEFRYWPKKNMDGRFYGFNANLVKYNIGGIKMPYYSDAFYYRYDGWIAGVGVSAGYMWYLSKNWSFEANFGFGVSYTSYDKYLQPVCGAYWGSYKNILFMPTKIGLSVVYKFN